jgi:hypothetical protein
MNWERILRAYVDYVQTMEGTTFLTYGNSELDLLGLSPDETEHLVAIGEGAEMERESMLREWLR